MLWLSEMLMREHDISSFEELKKAVRAHAEQGELHFGMDTRPPFKDTPPDWEDQLEVAFYSKR